MELGAGEYGKVYEYEYEKVKYAGKVIKPSKFLVYKDYIEREIEILKIMSKCENSVKYFCDYIDKDINTKVIILELCDSKLEDLLYEKKEGFDNSQIKSIMKGLNNAFKYMLMNNIVHRDIKLENIMIKYTDSSHKQFIPKLSDYGISRELKNSEIASTICGSKPFMAPEIFLEKPYTNKTDLWSIGVMIYFMHFKDYPFEIIKKISKNKNLVKEYLDKKKKKECKDLVLNDLLDKLLTYDPIKRLTWKDYFNHPFFKEEEEKKFILISDYVLEYMTFYSYIEKLRIKKDETSSSNKFISIDECIEFKDGQFFILGILGKYLENIGVHVVIEKDKINKDENEEFYDRNIYQLICNNYILKYKYSLDFELKKERLFELIRNDDKKCKFNENLKKALVKAYNLDEEEIMIINYKRVKENFSAIVIFKSDFNKDITKDELLNIFKDDEELKLLTNVQKELIIPAIRFNQSMLNRFENTKKNHSWPENEKRGGEKYIPPKGWEKYGLIVYNKFDNKNNDWIMSDNRPGEWCVGYCGFTGITKRMSQQYDVDNDFKHNGKKVGVGVYCYNDPNEMEENTEIINTSVGDYKIGFMARVKPDKIRNPESNKGIWVVDGNDNVIRPYGILIKKINNVKK